MDVGAHPVRLSLFASLYQHGKSTVADLIETLDVTRENASRHLQRMADAGVVELDDASVGDRSQTTAVLTADGEALFEDHVEQLQRRIDALE